MTRDAASMASDAIMGADLVSRAARSLRDIASSSGGDGAEAIMAPSLDVAAATVRECAEIMSGLSQALANLDRQEHSTADINAFVFWCAASASAVDRLAAAAAAGVIGAAEMIALKEDARASAGQAREEARRGALLLVDVAKDLSLVVAALTDQNASGA